MMVSFPKNQSPVFNPMASKPLIFSAGKKKERQSCQNFKSHHTLIAFCAPCRAFSFFADRQVDMSSFVAIGLQIKRRTSVKNMLLMFHGGTAPGKATVHF